MKGIKQFIKESNDRGKCAHPSVLVRYDKDGEWIEEVCLICQARWRRNRRTYYSDFW